MTSSVVSPQPATAPVRDAPSRWQGPWRLFALLPLWIYLIFSATQGPSLGGPFGEPPKALGLPLDVWLTILVGSWTIAGLALIWDARSWPRRALALFLFTIPATFVMILGPAVILIVQNLG